MSVDTAVLYTTGGMRVVAETVFPSSTHGTIEVHTYLILSVYF